VTSRNPTLTASVPPPASGRISAPIRGLSIDLLDAPAAVAFARLAGAPAVPADPEGAKAADFFAAFGPPDDAL
jgi:hypothetical protein